MSASSELSNSAHVDSEAEARTRLAKQRFNNLMHAAGFLKPSRLLIEPELIEKKWPAYRKLDPWQANIKFATAYQAAFKQQMHEDVDIRLAKQAQGINLAWLHAPKHLKGHKAKGGKYDALHYARQVADSSGLPYEVFAKFCIQFAQNRGVTWIARPNQLIPPARFHGRWQRELGNKTSNFREAMPSRFREELEQDYSGAPGCFGVPGAAADRCSGCEYASGCQRVQEKVRTWMKKEGMLLYDEFRKEVIAERKAKKAFRERQRRAERKRAMHIARDLSLAQGSSGA